MNAKEKQKRCRSLRDKRIRNEHATKVINEFREFIGGEYMQVSDITNYFKGNGVTNYGNVVAYLLKCNIFKLHPEARGGQSGGANRINNLRTFTQPHVPITVNTVKKMYDSIAENIAAFNEVYNADKKIEKKVEKCLSEITGLEREISAEFPELITWQSIDEFKKKATLKINGVDFDELEEDAKKYFIMFSVLRCDNASLIQYLHLKDERVLSASFADYAEYLLDRSEVPELTDKELVSELRTRGYDVTAKKYMEL